MESQIKVMANYDEMSRFFNDSEPWDKHGGLGLSVRYFEYVGGGWYEMILRHAELDKPLGRSYKSIGNLVSAIRKRKS